MAADEPRIRDSPRAIDATDLIKKGRRAALWKMLLQLLMLGILVALVVFMVMCLVGIMEYSGQTEVPIGE